LIWIETPANPMWDITDPAAAASIAHAAEEHTKWSCVAGRRQRTNRCDHEIDLAITVVHQRSWRGNEPSPNLR
jgi:cystathionine gamma-synthase